MILPNWAYLVMALIVAWAMVSGVIVLAVIYTGARAEEGNDRA
jgi:hypothetical protein